MARKLKDPKFLTKEYTAWCNMRARCSNPKRDDYKRYGGRGIKVCERWNSFDLFRQDMGPSPPKASIDRIDNSRGYSPENCRWATSLQQCQNRRPIKLSREDARWILWSLAYAGCTQSACAKAFEVSKQLVCDIVKGRTWKDECIGE